MRDRIPDVVLYTRALFNGGTDQVMLNLAIEFARRGLVVRFVVDTHNPYSPFVSKLPEDVGYVVLDAESIPARLSKLRTYLIENTPKVLISAGLLPEHLRDSRAPPRGRGHTCRRDRAQQSDCQSQTVALVGSTALVHFLREAHVSAGPRDRGGVEWHGPGLGERNGTAS